MQRCFSDNIAFSVRYQPCRTGEVAFSVSTSLYTTILEYFLGYFVSPSVSDAYEVNHMSVNTLRPSLITIVSLDEK